MKGQKTFNAIGGMLPRGGGSPKGLFAGFGAIATLGALGFGINASLFNGREFYGKGIIDIDIDSF
jgi:hypothetical protein